MTDMKIQQDEQLILNAQKKGRLATLGAYTKLSGPGWLQSAITLGGGSLAGSLYLGVLGGASLLWLQPIAMIMGVIMLMYIITGFFMDCMAVVFITVPLLYPTVLALGFDPLWFGVMIVLVAGIGSITPPYGIIVFAISGMVKDVPMWSIFRGCFPFLFTNIVAVVIMMFVPQIAYWLPYLTSPVGAPG